MAKRNAIRWMGVFIATGALALFACAYVMATLFAPPIKPVVFDAPPTLAPKTVAADTAIADDAAGPELVADAPAPSSPTGEDLKVLAGGVFFEGKAREQFIAYFSHPDQEVRMAAARALARCYAANGGIIEPRAHGPEREHRREFMETFWLTADKPAVLKALLEDTTTSFERDDSEYRRDDVHVLFLLGWFPGLNSERAEILTWVAEHHPSSSARGSAMFYLVHGSFGRKIADKILDSRAADPSFRIRYNAWWYRMERTVWR